MSARKLSGPVADDDCEAAFDNAIDELIDARSPGCHADPGAVLDALASLALKITATVPDVVADAREQGYTWAQIAALLGGTKRAVKRRYARNAKDWRPPLELD
jgi:predicted component of type VI protein secretion system